jgi:hypothetical protein
MKQSYWGWFGCLSIACAAENVALTKGGEHVVARKSDAPPGAKEIGPIEATHGNGCGGFGALGNFEGALAMLRNRAAEMGANYVTIMTMTEPYGDGQCRHNEFAIRGIAYRIQHQSATGVVVQPMAQAQPTTDPREASECTPPCSPGYVCQTGTCRAVCNPACRPGYTCGQDRVCARNSTVPTSE